MFLFLFTHTYIYIYTTYIAKARSPVAPMKACMKAMKAKVAKRPAAKTRKTTSAPAKTRKTTSATSKMGDKTAASLRYKPGKRDIFWYGLSKIYTVWNNGSGRYRVYQKPGDKVEAGIGGFSTDERSREAWAKVANLLVKLNGKPRA